MKKGTTLQIWLRKNGWNMFVFFASAIFGAGVGVTAFQSQVRANTENIQTLEDNLAEYPSQDYFELKFEVIFEDIKELKEAIKELD